MHVITHPCHSLGKKTHVSKRAQADYYSICPYSIFLRSQMDQLRNELLKEWALSICVVRIIAIFEVNFPAEIWIYRSMRISWYSNTWLHWKNDAKYENPVALNLWLSLMHLISIDTISWWNQHNIKHRYVIVVALWMDVNIDIWTETCLDEANVSSTSNSELIAIANNQWFRTGYIKVTQSWVWWCLFINNGCLNKWTNITGYRELMPEAACQYGGLIRDKVLCSWFKVLYDIYLFELSINLLLYLACHT